MALLGEPIPVQEDDPDATRYYNAWLRDLFVAARNLTLTSREGAPQDGDKAGNLNGVWSVFTSNAVADTEDTIAHNLGRIPIGRLLGDQDKAASLYRSGTDWTSSAIYVKSSAASVAWKLVLF